ncbi:MAG TPA: hypothetical protein VJM81_07625 [Rhizorhapis sp.]|nr:hypothetical protein [Rhizorhapis sp.]
MAKQKAASKLPKRIAGIKLPKELRKSGGSMLTLARTPLGRELIASGLIAAAAALTASDGHRKAGKGAKKAGDAADKGLDQLGDTAQAIGSAVAAAMEKWFGGARH